MRIWIDMAHSPQVLFFRPLIAALKNRGHDLILTTRRSAETIQLADRLGYPHTTIGGHGGEHKAGKISALALRAAGLLQQVAGKKIDLALNHGSYAQGVAVAVLRKPMVLMYDYEGHPGLHILCRVARKILVPHVFSKENLYRYGATTEKIDSFNGLKENIYLADFKPDPTFLSNHRIPDDKIIVTLRPPNPIATYHQFENPLFDQAFEYVLNHRETFLIVLPRTEEQRQHYRLLGRSNVLVPSVLSGPDLIYYSDLVIGAGGTMNREAATLGTPVYTVFKGLWGSVDQYLVETGKMTRIEASADIKKICVVRKQKDPSVAEQLFQAGSGLLDSLIGKIMAVVG
jgi:uncharacterized protein